MRDRSMRVAKEELRGQRAPEWCVTTSLISFGSLQNRWINDLGASQANPLTPLNLISDQALRLSVHPDADRQGNDSREQGSEALGQFAARPADSDGIGRERPSQAPCGKGRNPAGMHITQQIGRAHV